MASWAGADGNSCSAVFPPTRGSHPAAGSSAHRQVILRLECRRVGRVSGWHDSVRDRAVIVPLAPYILDPSVTALR